LLYVLKDNGHIKFKASKYERMDAKIEFRKQIEEFKAGVGYLELKDYVMNDKITITWIENDYFQTKWDKFKKEMPKEFNIETVKDKDEEIKQYLE